MKAASPPAAEYVTVASLRPWVKNPRKNDPAVAAVADSIKRFGFGSPIIARRENGEIIAGHTRLKAAIKLGLAEVPVRYLDLSEAEAHALALADNKVGELAEWDDVALADVLRDLTADDVSMDGLGFTAEEIAALIGGGDDPSDTPDPGAPEVEEGPAHSVAGEVYELGPHRLACGDSTDGAVWEALLGTDRLRMVWTDPPYGVAIVGGAGAGGRGVSAEERAARGGKVIQNDALSPADLEVFLRAALGEALGRCEKGAAWYVAAPDNAAYFMAFATVLTAMEVWRHSLIWLKSSFVMGRADYHYRHEHIYYGWAPGAAHYFIDDRKQDTILEYPRPASSKDHPTMKPVELVERCISNSSQPGWIVGEPFGGSGTTLLACARTGRVARLVELSPHYCDVIRRRWTRWAKEAGQEPGTGALDG
jgi:site-specific DNA-methyltransferase (adenine-specific)